MNAAEKKVLHIAFFLFLVGIVVRFLPWGLPAIDSVDIGDRPKSQFSQAPPSKLEYMAATPEKDEAVLEKPPKKERKRASRKKRKNKALVHFPLHINVATADELCALKGVGPKLAEKIIAFREAHGPFDGPSSLQKVPGIGKKKLEGILQWVIFD